MSNASANLEKEASGSRERRAEWIFIWMSAGMLLLTRLAMDWFRPILDAHAFRQTQTGMTIYWYIRDGVDLLRPPLPLWGLKHPSAPMEFPAYQALAAWLGPLLTNSDMVQSVVLGGRVVNFLSYLLVGALCWWIVRRELGKADAVGFVAYWLFLPFLMFWSVTVMIEFTALLPAILYVYSGRLWIKSLGSSGNAGRTWGWFIFCLATGVMGYLFKVTTATLYVPLLAAILGYGLWKGGNLKSPLKIALSLVLLGVPFASGVAWVRWSDHIKNQNELGARQLTSTFLAPWNFGTLAQRLDWHQWAQALGQAMTAEICAVVLLVPLAIGVYRDRRCLWWYAVVSPAVLAVLVYFNLYVQHSYYWISITPVLMLVAARGTTMISNRFAGHADSRMTATGGSWALCLLIVALCWSSVGAMNQIVDRGRHQPIYFLLPFVRSMPQSQQAFLQMTSSVRAHVPDREPLVVIGEGFSSRVPFYAQRPAIMATWPSGPEFWQKVEDSEYPGYALVFDPYADDFARGTGAMALERYPEATLFRITAGPGSGSSMKP